MKIKQKNLGSPFKGMIRKSLKKRKFLTLGMLGAGSLLAIAIVFFSVLSYGAHLRQIGVMTYMKNTAVEMARLDFSFLKNYTRGQLHEFEEMQIDIKFKHLLRIQYLREQALASGVISKAMKDEEFPATITFKGKSHNVKISLTGLIAVSHLKDPNKWSFQVKVKGDGTIDGMKRFGMLRPSTRGYMTDWLGFELMKEKGLMGLRVDYVDVTVNGKSVGIYYMEERFDKYLVENNRLREGILFKLDNEFSAYQEAKLMESPGTREQLLLIKRMWQEVMAGNLEPGRFFDMEKMAQVFVICDLMNNKHPLALQNIRFYFNPITGLAEPIAREWEKLERADLSTLRLFPEKPGGNPRHYKLEKDPVLRIIYDNLEFKRHYVQQAEIMSQPKFLNQVLARNEDKLNALLNKVYRVWPFYDLPTDKLYQHQAYMHSVLFPETHQLGAYFNKREGKRLSLSLLNQQYLPVEVAYLTWRDSFKIYPETPVILDSKVKEQPQLFTFQIPDDLKWSDSMAEELKAHYSLLGSQAGKRTIDVLPYVAEEQAEPAKALTRSANYTSVDFLTEDQEQNLITIPAGNWTLSKDLIIPKNKRLEINAGAQIDLVKGAALISYSPVFGKGTEEEPIIFMSSDSTSRGLAVIQASDRSNLSHVVFDHLAGTAEGEGLTPGALNFYESDVDLSACTFSNSRSGRAFFYFRQSDFFMDQSVFKNIDANAIHADLSTGLISNSSFVNIKQTGISAVASDLTLEKIFMNIIAGPGIDAQNNAMVTARWLDIRKAEIGLAGKDYSKFVITDAKLQKNKIGVALYQQDPESGPASVTAERLTLQEVETPHLIEENSKLIIDGAPMVSKEKNVSEQLIND